MRDSFIFYKSFYDATKELSTEEQAQVVLAIMQYQFDGTEPVLEGVPKAIFTLIKPQLDANNTRYENGCKGGAPKGNSNAKKQPKNNQETTEKQANENVNENVNENNIPPISPQGETEEREIESKECESEEDKRRFNFEILWDEYPRKDGKANAFRYYKTWLTGKQTPFGKKKLTNNEMLEAIQNYKKQIAERHIEPKYIKQGSTFFNLGILDYLPKEEDG